MSKYVRELDSLAALTRSNGQLGHAVVQGLDLRKLDVDWHEVKMEGTVFLGCRFPEGVDVCELVEKGALVFPGFGNLPFDPYRPRLYCRAELMEGWTASHDGSVDKRIYDYFVKAGRHRPDVLDALAQRLHDHAVEDAMYDLLEGRTDRGGKKKVVGVMGGHGTPRTDPYYWKVARIAQQLTREGYFVATGGGPGIMEAANLGAYLADASEKELEGALMTLGHAEVYTDRGYMEAAQEVLDLFPHGHPSLAVPTWFYGHEPSNLFSVHIAKYFSNSLREDGLLTIANHGIVFAPGSAGTTQEVFQDATQNHYQTYGVVSPMIFLGKEHYGEQTGIFDCLSRQAAGKPYAEALLLTNSGEKTVDLCGNTRRLRAKSRKEG
jgi:predicted Rossmann-fold nucleotide-binding protein